ncbi:MAG: DegT/DnrJ/EryC1/StrS family aminotransferase [Chitinophagales bacterium]|nr:DegT/DnrJ/EryC1/StrS family aminotransferase [Hyphomicrobiales bacterium]
MIPLLDLRAQYDDVGPEVEAAVIAVLRSGAYILGPSVEEFERNFAAFCGAEHAIGLNSGTSALHLALLALGVGPGDEVITVPMTFVATVAAIQYSGARAVLVDVDPETFVMDPAGLEKAITPRTKAIVPVHLHGRLADMEAISRIADAHGVPILEDAAQAHGARRDGKSAGVFGKAAAFSFYPGKNLGACGEGGAVVTNDAHVAKLVRQLRDWGQEGRYNHVMHGFNYRMDGVQGAALGVKLSRLGEWSRLRREVAAQYNASLENSLVKTPPLAKEDHVWHVYAVRTDRRDQLADHLREHGVSTGLHYPNSVHLQGAYAHLGYREGDFPVSEQLAKTFLSLPIYPELTPEQIARVTDAVHGAKCLQEGA